MRAFSIAFFLFFTGLAGSAQVIPAIIIPSALIPADTVPLPIHNFTLNQKDGKAFLRWKSDSLPAVESFYVIERSNNGTDFSPVGITKNTNGGWFEFLDDAPKGKLFYRVKLSTAQTSYYSEVIAATPSADVSCKFYPNPVDKVLIIKSELNIDLQISDGTGKLLIAERLQGGLKVVDVSSLEPGIYVITLFQKETNKIVVDKLVKK